MRGDVMIDALRTMATKYQGGITAEEVGVLMDAANRLTRLEVYAALARTEHAEHAKRMKELGAKL